VIGQILDYQSEFSFSVLMVWGASGVRVRFSLKPMPYQTKMKLLLDYDQI